MKGGARCPGWRQFSAPWLSGQTCAKSFEWSAGKGDGGYKISFTTVHRRLWNAGGVTWNPDAPTFLLTADVDGGTFRLRVAGSLRGQGIGNLTVRWAIDESRRRGCTLVQLTTHKSRTAATGSTSGWALRPAARA
ncbi:hypothetical protein GCM10009712_35890 [Pseudarthrobacter sulfonivorans]